MRIIFISILFLLNASLSASTQVTVTVVQNIATKEPIYLSDQRLVSFKELITEMTQIVLMDTNDSANDIMVHVKYGPDISPETLGKLLQKINDAGIKDFRLIKLRKTTGTRDKANSIKEKEVEMQPISEEDSKEKQL
jgi:hypothetical protein